MIIIGRLNESSRSRNKTWNKMNHTVKNRFTIVREYHGQSNRFWNNFNYLNVNFLTPESESLMVKVLSDYVP